VIESVIQIQPLIEIFLRQLIGGRNFKSVVSKIIKKGCNLPGSINQLKYGLDFCDTTKPDTSNCAGSYFPFGRIFIGDM